MKSLTLAEQKASILRAMLGEVTPRLAALTMGVEGNVVRLRAYYDSPVAQADEEHCSCIAAEVIADFEDKFLLGEEVLPYPENPPKMLDFWVFIREGVKVKSS